MTPEQTPLAIAVAALVVPELAHSVDLVIWPAHGDDNGSPREIHVANSRGELILSAQRPDGVVVRGLSPWGSTDPMAFITDVAEAADPSPPAERNSYPLPWLRLSSFFSDPRSPDVAIVHTGSHYFPERGGHVGEHGSLSVIQSRAPFLLSGAGVRTRGEVADFARLVDVMPTLAWVCGVPSEQLSDLDGVVRDDLVSDDAHHIIGLLWDGAHPGSLLRMAKEGLLPNVNRLLERGCWLTGGAVAEFPSLTLVNHTSMLTGVGPGRHGVVGNAYVDRTTEQRVVPNDAARWHRTAELYRPGVRTLFEAVVAAMPGAYTASVNEMTERGAQFSTFALVREALAQERAGSSPQPGSLTDDFISTVRAWLPDPLTSPLVTSSWCEQEDNYAFYSAVDLLGLETVLGLWSDEAIDSDRQPVLTWWSSYATDAAHHAGGPRSAIASDSFIDCDRRLGVLLDRLEQTGALDNTLILLTADHGFESANKNNTGDWNEALERALTPTGIRWRQEGPGLLYLL